MYKLTAHAATVPHSMTMALLALAWCLLLYGLFVTIQDAWLGYKDTMETVAKLEESEVQ